MKLPISPRLLACADFIAPCHRVADIGCDHGYLSIHLIQQGIAREVIASDIRPKPLLSAKSNARTYGVDDRIQFYLSDGAKNIPQDFDTLVCAGMGGITMVSILQAAPWLKSEKYRLVLQCQSKISILREYLFSQGWRIEKETVVRDGRFLYPVMLVRYQPDTPTPDLCRRYFPTELLETPTEEIAEYYHRVLKKLRLHADGHGEQTPPQLLAALEALEALKEIPNYSFLKENAL